MLAQGFQVHHMDGNHFNDDPANLVLIEGSDHMRLHGMKTRLPDELLHTRRRKHAERLAQGKAMYEERLSGTSWREAVHLHMQSDREIFEVNASRGIVLAKEYAVDAGREWPIDVPKVLLPAYHWRDVRAERSAKLDGESGR